MLYKCVGTKEGYQSFIQLLRILRTSKPFVCNIKYVNMPSCYVQACKLHDMKLHYKKYESTWVNVSNAMWSFV